MLLIRMMFSQNVIYPKLEEDNMGAKVWCDTSSTKTAVRRKPHRACFWPTFIFSTKTVEIWFLAEVTSLFIGRMFNNYSWTIRVLPNTLLTSRKNNNGIIGSPILQYNFNCALSFFIFSSNPAGKIFFIFPLFCLFGNRSAYMIGFSFWNGVSFSPILYIIVHCVHPYFLAFSLLNLITTSYQNGYWIVCSDFSNLTNNLTNHS